MILDGCGRFRRTASTSLDCYVLYCIYSLCTVIFSALLDQYFMIWIVCRKELRCEAWSCTCWLVLSVLHQLRAIQLMLRKTVRCTAAVLKQTILFRTSQMSFHSQQCGDLASTRPPVIRVGHVPATRQQIENLENSQVHTTN